MRRVLLAAAVSVVMVAAGFATAKRRIPADRMGRDSVDVSPSRTGSGQFTTGPVNSVTPPYDGAADSGFSGMIPSRWPGIYISLPDTASVLSPTAPTSCWRLPGGAVLQDARQRHDLTRPGPGARPHAVQRSGRTAVVGLHHRRTGLRPPRLLPAVGAAGGADPPDSRRPRDPAGPAADRRRLRRRVDRPHGRRHVLGRRGVRSVSPALRRARAAAEPAGAPSRLRAPQNPQNAVLGAANLPSSRGFESMTCNGNGTKLYLTTEASIESERDKRLLDIYEFDTRTRAVHRPQLQVRQGQLRPDHRRRRQRHQYLHHRRHDPPGRRPLHHHRARRLPGAAEQREPAAPEEALPDRSRRDRSGDRHPREAAAGRPARHRRPEGHRRSAARGPEAHLHVPAPVGRVGDADRRLHAAGRARQQLPGGNGRVPGTGAL